MARIDVLPSIDIIMGLKGVLDFYIWRGLPCVRAWPRYRPARQTAASLAAALVFGAIIKSYSLLGNVPLAAYREDARDQPRTARDIMVTGVYGNLHEASMSDFLTLLVECRDFLSDLTALLNALDSIDTDELVVNVDQTVLPPGAAIEARQLSQLLALQKIDDLQDALESKALDRLLVRGMDQLFTISKILHERKDAPISGNDGFLDSIPVPAGEIWQVTTIGLRDATTGPTQMLAAVRHAGTDVIIQDETRAFTTAEWCIWTGQTYLFEGDFIRGIYLGGLAGDDCYVDISGYVMTLET